MTSDKWNTLDSKLPLAQQQHGYITIKQKSVYIIVDLALFLSFSPSLPQNNILKTFCHLFWLTSLECDIRQVSLQKCEQFLFFFYVYFFLKNENFCYKNTICRLPTWLCVWHGTRQQKYTYDLTKLIQCAYRLLMRKLNWIEPVTYTWKYKRTQGNNKQSDRRETETLSFPVCSNNRHTAA